MNQKQSNQDFEPIPLSFLLNKDAIKAAILGLAVGDALGVPVEFISRQELQKDPVTSMRAFGSHNQPAGTWSDDTSLTLCTLEALNKGYNVDRIAQSFVRWKDEAYMTAHAEVFDIGFTTMQAIERYQKGDKAVDAGLSNEEDNGNGSLMRMIPLLFMIYNMPVEERYRHTLELSSLTHAHIRSVAACFYYLEYARLLLIGEYADSAYEKLNSSILPFLHSINLSASELHHFDRLLGNQLYELEEEDIQSTGYVIHTLEASVWCLLHTDTFEEAVLKAVNLGEDTDTTAALTGSLVGLVYGYNAIPKNWLNTLARREEIGQLCEGFYEELWAKFH